MNNITQIIQNYFTENPWYSYGIELTLSIIFLSLFFLSLRRNRVALIRFVFILIGTVLFVVNSFLPLPLFGLLLHQIQAMWSLLVVIVLSYDVIRYLGDNPWESTNRAEDLNRDAQLIKTVTNAVELLRNKKTGALITFERESSLVDIIADSIVIDSEVTVELLQAIFNTKAPTHDGAIIIKNGRIACAGAFYNFADGVVDKTLGSRHRAALGLAQVRDSVTIVVSEETGQVSLAYDGILDRNLNKDSLGITLSNLLGTTQ
jgi:diadenylate cyclase